MMLIVRQLFIEVLYVADAKIIRPEKLLVKKLLIKFKDQATPFLLVSE